ncbi:MAG: thioesterase [Chlorobi bacterium]|nr:thioesterase [Chlorobiota bacterium]
MYPYLRLIKVLASKRHDKNFKVNDESIIKLRVCLVDIDPFLELNNGRYLTMMDFGRFDVAIRTGLWKIMKKKKWGLIVAGASVRFRYRLKLFQKYELHSQVIGQEEKWFYFHQRIIRNGRIHASALVRTAVTSREGIVNTDEVLKALGNETHLPGVPGWVREWAKADELRPWE